MWFDLLTRGGHPAMGPLGPLPCPLILKCGQRGACANFGDFADFLVLKTVQRREARNGTIARSGRPADIKRPCRPLLLTGFIMGRASTSLGDMQCNLCTNLPAAMMTMYDSGNICGAGESTHNVSCCTHVIVILGDNAGLS